MNRRKIKVEMKNKMNRRSFLVRSFGLGTFSLGTLGILHSCQSDSGEKEEKNGEEYVPKNCDDLSHVSDAEIKKREQMGYIKESTISGSLCGNCKLFIPPKKEGACGGCMLFDGPVRETGYCVQYEPIGQS